MSKMDNEETIFQTVTVKVEEDLLESDSNIHSHKDLCLEIVNIVKEEIKTENSDCNETLSSTSNEIKEEDISDTEDTLVCIKKVASKTNQMVPNKLFVPYTCTMGAISNDESHKGTFHMDDEPYRCVKCKFMTNNSKVMSHHMLNHSKRSSSTQAVKCQEKSPDTIIIDEDHPDESSATYRCPFCAYRTPVKEVMTKHYMQSHNITSKAKIYKCEHCIFKTTRLGLFKRHSKTHKGVPVLYKCDLCVYETHRKATMVNHKKIHEIAAMRTDYQATMCLF